MKKETDNPSDDAFEVYLREFRPDWRFDPLKRARLEASGLASRRVTWPWLWAAGLAAAAVLLLAVLLSAPETEEPQDISERTAPPVIETIAVPEENPEPVYAYQMVQYGTLLAAASKGPEALDRLLEKASPLLLVPTPEQDRADAARWSL